MLQQARYRLNKITQNAQILNFTHNIEDGFERDMVAGAVFVNFLAAYNTCCTNHINQ